MRRVRGALAGTRSQGDLAPGRRRWWSDWPVTGAAPLKDYTASMRFSASSKLSTLPSTTARSRRGGRRGTTAVKRRARARAEGHSGEEQAAQGGCARDTCSDAPPRAASLSDEEQADRLLASKRSRSAAKAGGGRRRCRRSRAAARACFRRGARYADAHAAAPPRKSGGADAESADAAENCRKPPRALARSRATTRPPTYARSAARPGQGGRGQPARGRRLLGPGWWARRARLPPRRRRDARPRLRCEVDHLLARRLDRQRRFEEADAVRPLKLGEVDDRAGVWTVGFAYTASSWRVRCRSWRVWWQTM